MRWPWFLQLSRKTLEVKTVGKVCQDENVRANKTRAPRESFVKWNKTKATFKNFETQKNEM